MAARAVRKGLAAVMIALAAASAGCSSAGDSSDAGSGMVASLPMRDPAVLAGTVTYLQRIALPKDAVVVIALYDLSRGLKPAGLIGEQRFEAGGQVPIAFQLTYDRALTAPSHTYGLQARILVDGALWFVNKQPVAASIASPAVTEILVRPAAAGD